RGFGARGYEVVAAFDSDPDKIGQPVAHLVIEPLQDLPAVVEARQIAIGIIATPASAPQDVAHLLRDAGVHSILNFAPTVVTTRPGVSLRKVDLAIELQILSYYQQRSAARATATVAATVS